MEIWDPKPLYLAWWWLNEPKHVAEFLILIANICCVYWLNKSLYYCKTQRDGSYQNKTRHLLLLGKQHTNGKSGRGTGQTREPDEGRYGHLSF